MADGSHVKEFDDRVRQARELVNRSNYLFRSFGIDNIDGYTRGHLYLAARRSLSEKPDYGFLIYAKRAGRDGSEIVRDGHRPLHGKAAGDDIDINQSAVLPLDIELMEGPQRFIPSLIRFQRFNDPALAVGQPVYQFRSLVVSADKGSLTPCDGEISIVRLAYAMACGKRGGEDIEAAADCIDVRTELDIERARERRFFDQYYDIVRRWRWRIFKCDFDVVAEPSDNPFLKGWQLGYGPINAGLSV